MTFLKFHLSPLGSSPQEFMVESTEMTALCENACLSEATDRISEQPMCVQVFLRHKRLVLKTQQD